MSARRRWIIAIVGAGGVAIVAAVVAVLVLVVFGNGDGGSEPEPARITVEEVINRVETERPRDPATGQAEFLPAQVGQDLSPGDGVKTFRESEARVDIVIRALTRITRSTPNTIWRLGQFALEEETIIELTQGKIFLFDEGSRERLRPVKVVTPAGTASPRGTWMSVEYNPEEGVAEVQCFRGVCELENELGSQLMTDEEKSTATAETPPEEPQLMVQEEKQEFTQLPEARSGEVVVPTPVVVPPTPTPAPPPTATAIVPPTATAAPLPEPTASAVVLPTATAAPVATAVPPTPVPTAARAAAHDPTPVPAQTLPPTSAPEPTATAVPLPTPTPEPTSTPVPTPTAIPTATTAPTATPAPTAAPAAVPLPPISSNVLPHVFVGTVTIGGVTAPDGTAVAAWIQGFSQPVGEGVVSGGSYVIQIPQYGATSFNGKTITFKIGAYNALETFVWQSGDGDELNLTSSN